MTWGGCARSPRRRKPLRSRGPSQNSPDRFMPFPHVQTPTVPLLEQVSPKHGSTRLLCMDCVSACPCVIASTTSKPILMVPGMFHPADQSSKTHFRSEKTWMQACPPMLHKLVHCMAPPRRPRQCIPCDNSSVCTRHSPCCEYSNCGSCTASHLRYTRMPVSYQVSTRAYCKLPLQPRQL